MCPRPLPCHCSPPLHLGPHGSARSKSMQWIAFIHRQALPIPSVLGCPDQPAASELATFHPFAQSFSRDAQQARSLTLVAAGFFNDLVNIPFDDLVKG